MKKIYQKKCARLKVITTVWLLMAVCLSGLTSARTVPLALNLSAPINANVIPGQTSAEITLSVNAVNSFRLQVIVPVDGAEFTLLNPAGVEALNSANPDVSFLDGSEQSPSLPGGVFITPAVEAPTDGDWTLRLQFPPASHKTVILATLFSETPYKVGIVHDRSEYRVGQMFSVGMIALENAQPITGLRPNIVITPPTGPATSFIGMDDGDINHFDGLINDGIYSGGYMFESAGVYTISGTVTIPTSNGSIERTASSTVTVTEPFITLENVEGTSILGTNGCIAGLNVKVAADALQASTYVASARLNASNGNFIEKTSSLNITSPQQIDFNLQFSADEIREKIGIDGPYTINPLDILNFQSRGC